MHTKKNELVARNIKYKKILQKLFKQKKKKKKLKKIISLIFIKRFV